MVTLISTVSTDFALEEIAANDIISRANYVYCFFAALGFAAGCFLLYSFIQSYRAHRELAWLDCLLWAFSGIQLLLLLLSLYAVAHRPKYLLTTALGCAALSFTINTACLCGLFVLVLMAYVLTLDPPSHAMLRKPGVCTALVIVTSVLIALVLAGIRGAKDVLEVKNCFMDQDSPQSSPHLSYAAALLFLGLLIPYTFQLGLLICGCIRQWRSKGRFLSGSEAGPVFLTVTAVMFFCQLFYRVVLVRAAQIKMKEVNERVFLSVAEFVFFSGSSASLLLVLFMHRPCRESLQRVLRQLKECCRNPGRTQPNRNIISPQIEITDTLQDIES